MHDSQEMKTDFNVSFLCRLSQSEAVTLLEACRNSWLQSLLCVNIA